MIDSRNPMGKKIKARLRKRWLDSLQNDLRRMYYTDWRDKAMGRRDWRKIVKETLVKL